MNSTYKIVETISDAVLVTKTADIAEWARIHDRLLTQVSKRRRSVLRKEIQDAPQISGLYGPMHDEENGVPFIRYEDEATYKSLSV